MSLYIVFFLLIFLGSCISEDPKKEPALGPGDRCPQFAIEFTDGSFVTTSMLHGKKSVIVFFNTTCRDCRSELPELQKVYETVLTERLPVNFLCISRAESEASVTAYWESNSFTMPVSAQDDRRVYNLFAVSIIPRVYIIDAAGVIEAVWTDSPIATADDILNFLRS